MDSEQFYVELLHELGRLARDGGTAVGAAAVAKRVALDHGLTMALWVPLPRLTRAEYDALHWDLPGRDHAIPTTRGSWAKVNLAAGRPLGGRDSRGPATRSG